ncbi:NADH-quinone oxidoreductase subunit NuoN [Gottfriedia luciferensis]|uniref:NADH-quinone oxidoreductase subunit NuoN n=1 Tax=Gottfriedia luciferensis TaxID=178774 RepID=UPI000B451201|nr:NADH-quinone oxidoreductase subunit NuoN [Gottfriedia luciferensis]
MTWKALSEFQWGTMGPEIILVAAVLLLLTLELLLPKNTNRKVLGWIGLLSIVASLIWTFTLYSHGPTSLLAGSFKLDSFGLLFKTVLLIGAILILLLALGDQTIAERSEYYTLFITALLGTMYMASSSDLITLFVGLELLSISSYILVGIQKRREGSSEAALKYVINGGISTAITLFGLSYTYGLTGTTNITEMNMVLSQGVASSNEFLLILAFVLVFVGLSFKLASVPFHMWAPDVYEGAPTPVTAFLATVSKTGGFIIVLRVFLSIFAGALLMKEQKSVFEVLSPVIAVLAALSMILGNTIALKQNNLKRILAYSGIAHGGYVLVAFVSISPFMFESIWFYLLAYTFMTIGILTIVYNVQQQRGSDSLASFAGLVKTNPILSVALTIFVLSLAGIPLTSGFIGKLNIFMGAFVQVKGNYVLGGILLLTTVVSYFYYFGILQNVFFRSGEERKVVLPKTHLFVVLVCVVLTIVLGIKPSLALDVFHKLNIVKDFFMA